MFHGFHFQRLLGTCADSHLPPLPTRTITLNLHLIILHVLLAFSQYHEHLNTCLARRTRIIVVPGVNCPRHP